MSTSSKSLLPGTYTCLLPVGGGLMRSSSQAKHSASLWELRQEQGGGRCCTACIAASTHDVKTSTDGNLLLLRLLPLLLVLKMPHGLHTLVRHTVVINKGRPRAALVAL
ncbi:unnamed protein product [Ectocarpus sp. 12 AP-2014]